MNNWKNHEHQLVSRMSSINSILGDGFKYLFFTPKIGEMIQFDSYFANGLVKNHQPGMISFKVSSSVLNPLDGRLKPMPKGRSGRTHGFGGRSCPRNTVSETLRHRWCLGNLHIGKPRVWALIQGPNLQPCHWKV